MAQAGIGDVVVYHSSKDDGGEDIAAIVTDVVPEGEGPDRLLRARLNLTIFPDGGAPAHVQDVPPRRDAKPDGAYYLGKQYV